MKELLADYIIYLKAKGNASNTVQDKIRVLDFFFSWLQSKGILKIVDADKKTLGLYQAYVLALKQEDGRPYSTDRQRRYLTGVLDFFCWANTQNLVLINPALDMELPRIRQSLPGNVLSLEEIEEAIAGISLKNAIGLRNRSILELLFATGLRNSEISRLTLNDLDFERRRIAIRKSKGLKDRILPISYRCGFWLKHYLNYGRKKLLKNKDSVYVYLSIRAGRISKNQFLTIIKGCFGKKAADVNLRLLRHSYATYLLDRGMDIRYIQELLGHKNLATTEIYTRVSIGRLKAVHRKTHPLEKD